MEAIKQRLTDLGFNAEEIDKWLNNPVRALSPNYQEDTTPKQLIDAGKADVVLSLLYEIESGFAV